MVKCFICLKFWKIHDDCFKNYYGKWSKHNHLFHCKDHMSQCFECQKSHAPSDQHTLKRYVRNNKVHYMTEKCAEIFNTKQSDRRYMHDAFFDTWCYDISINQNWLYHIELDCLHNYLQYLFTQDEYKIMNKTINQEHLQVRIIKSKNIIKLKENKVMCDKDMETYSDSESDEAANVCWANSMI